jgi:hypothetical protein
MKKIVALGAIAALAGGMIFADEPAIDMKVAEFNGNATVKWGMDLDAGQHGFENSTGDTNLKVNLWNEGSKATEGDGIWGEVKITGKGLAIKNKAFDGDGNVELNEAKIHFGEKVYLGIKSGDTQVGEYKFDGAIRSADNGNAKWLSNVGPADFSQGIVLGYGDDNFGIDVDFRSYKTDKTNTNYTSAYGIAAEAKLKDSNEFVSGLAVDAGIAYNLSENYYIKGDDDSLGAMSDKYFAFDGDAFEASSLGYVKPDAPESDGLYHAGDKDPFKTEKDDVDAKKNALAAAEKTFKATPSAGNYDAVETAKEALTKAEKALTKAQAVNAAAEALVVPPKAERSKQNKYHNLGYNFNASYKFSIDDTYYVKPAVGLVGSVNTITGDKYSMTAIGNNLVAGVLFGWGATADANAGVPFLDGDGAKKVTPGVSVVAAIPLATSVKTDVDGKSTEKNYHSAVQAIIVPSIYTGDLVENLKFGAYSEMALLRGYVENKDDAKDQYDYAVTDADDAEKTSRTFGLAFAAGVSYDIKSDDLTITPKAGIRYANTAYVQNKIGKMAPLSSNALFETGYGKMGVGQKAKDNGDNDNYFNLKAGVDVNGLIANTTLFAEYASANLMNDQEYKAKNAYDEEIKHYNIKNGTFNIGCKIHF